MSITIYDDRKVTMTRSYSSPEGQLSIEANGVYYNFDHVPETFQEAIDMVQAVQKDVLVQKQKGYGPENILRGGSVGVVTRLFDKVERLRTLHGLDKLADVETLYEIPATAPENTAETISDTWVDTANYATIGAMVRLKVFRLPLESKGKIGVGCKRPE